MGLFRNLLGLNQAQPRSPQREHLVFPAWPAAIYAVGDVHGCFAQMQALEKLIVADSAPISGEKWIIYLGDYLDRGPESASVLDKLLARAPDGFRRLAIVGNHEVMALDFLREPRPRADWLEFGGQETLYSYGLAAGAIQSANGRARRAIIDSHVPAEHISLLEQLPLSISVPGYVFVHAGLRRGVALADQQERDLLWIRDEFFSAPLEDGPVVVHGHTPGEAPVVVEGRICVDTGAYATGVLTAVKLVPGAPPVFFSTTRQ